MAGWIKMRGELVSHPKVVAMARILNSEREFRDWLTPGGGGPMNGQIVSSGALRSVTVALLLAVWSRARESGEFSNNDLVLPHTTIDDIDQMSGAPCVGQAMVTVGWVIENEDGCGVTLPNFKRYNAPMDVAERVRKHRAARNGTAVTCNENETHVTRQRREEKRREEKTNQDTDTGGGVIVGDPWGKPKRVYADPPREPAAAAADPATFGAVVAMLERFGFAKSNAFNHAKKPGATPERVRWLVEEAQRRLEARQIDRDKAMGFVVAGIRDRLEPDPGPAVESVEDRIGRAMREREELIAKSKAGAA